MALELADFSHNVLKMLATIPHFELKYLRLGEISNLRDFSGPQFEIEALRYREAFHQLLPQFRKLKVLETHFVSGMINEIIQLLVDLDLNLKFVVLWYF